MRKTLTKQLLYRAAVKKQMMIIAIIMSILLIMGIVVNLFAYDDFATAISEIMWLPVVLLLFFPVFLLMFLLLSRKLIRFITKQERVLQVSFSDDMSKEGIIYKGFRAKKYISDNWFIYGPVAVHNNYIARVDNLNTRIRGGDTGTHSMVIKAICIDGKRFEIETDDCTYDEFLEWYAKVNPEDPMWKREYSHRASLEGRNLPEGWMAPRKKKKEK